MHALSEAFGHLLMPWLPQLTARAHGYSAAKALAKCCRISNSRTCHKTGPHQSGELRQTSLHALSEVFSHLLMPWLPQLTVRAHGYSVAKALAKCCTISGSCTCHTIGPDQSGELRQTSLHALSEFFSHLLMPWLP